MSNEEMCVLIQQGHTEYISELWERVQDFLYMKSNQIYKTHKDRCIKCGVELNDIKQSSYFAFRSAITAFKEERGFKFLSFIGYPFRTCVYELLQLRTVREYNEPLNACASVDEPLKHADDDMLTLLETIADSDSDFVEKLEIEEEKQMIREAVDGLDQRERSVIQLHFYEEKTLTDISESLNVSPERVRQIKVSALRELRHNETLRCIYYGGLPKYQPTIFDYFRHKRK